MSNSDITSTTIRSGSARPRGQGTATATLGGLVAGLGVAIGCFAWLAIGLAA